MARIPSTEAVDGWRQWKHLFKKGKRIVRKIGKIRKSVKNSKKGKNATKNKAKKIQQEKLNKEFVKIHAELIEICDEIVIRTEKDLIHCGKNKEKVQTFVEHAKRQINQIDRRIIKGETIPQEEKVYSVFEPHTEWISKGKAGVPQELGLRVSIVEDQHGFILNHRVMEKQTDDQIAVPIIQETKDMFPNLRSCSFDKGYHSPSNKIELSEILDEVVLPKKGKLSQSQLTEETSDDFINARNQHSAVESAINSLEHHGLDRCLDLGIEGFKRYVSLGILAKNVYQLGRILLAKEKRRLTVTAEKSKPTSIAA